MTKEWGRQFLLWVNHYVDCSFVMDTVGSSLYECRFELNNLPVIMHNELLLAKSRKQDTGPPPTKCKMNDSSMNMQLILLMLANARAYIWRTLQNTFKWLKILSTFLAYLRVIYYLALEDRWARGFWILLQRFIVFVTAEDELDWNNFHHKSILLPWVSKTKYILISSNILWISIAHLRNNSYELKHIPTH